MTVPVSAPNKLVEQFINKRWIPSSPDAPTQTFTVRFVKRSGHFILMRILSCSSCGGLPSFWLQT
jgi:hypothetical protein